MKKIISLIAVIMMSLCAIESHSAEPQGATISFAKKNHDFGNIHSRGGKVTTQYEFTNTGDSPLIIISADAKCGCTKPSYPSEPVAPGQKGVITVSFNPVGYAGEITKQIVVRTNDKKNRKVVLKLQCVVIPDK